MTRNWVTRRLLLGGTLYALLASSGSAGPSAPTLEQYTPTPIGSQIDFDVPEFVVVDGFTAYTGLGHRSTSLKVHTYVNEAADGLLIGKIQLSSAVAGVPLTFRIRVKMRLQEYLDGASARPGWYHALVRAANAFGAAWESRMFLLGGGRVRAVVKVASQRGARAPPAQ